MVTGDDELLARKFGTASAVLRVHNVITEENTHLARTDDMTVFISLWDRAKCGEYGASSNDPGISSI